MVTAGTAQFEDASVSVEAGIADMLIRMETGRFKAFKRLTDWWDEFRLYHRKDGRLHKEGDDLMSAMRYAVMMLRYARTNLPHPASKVGAETRRMAGGMSSPLSQSPFCTSLSDLSIRSPRRRGAGSTWAVSTRVCWRS
jgi:hypothetical protein